MDAISCIAATRGGSNHTKFDHARYHSLRDKSNAKFADTSGRPDGEWGGGFRKGEK